MGQAVVCTALRGDPVVTYKVSSLESVNISMSGVDLSWIVNVVATHGF